MPAISPHRPRAPRFLCLGGAVIDRKFAALAPLAASTSNPARGQVGFGGVARNVAENLARLGADVALASCVGDDPQGRALLAHLAALGADISRVRVIPGAATAEYVALLEPGGGLHIAASDMAVLDNIYGPLVDEALASAADSDWLFADCNAPAPVLADIARHAARHGLKLAVDVISTPKALRLPADIAGIACLFLNQDEAAAVLGQAAAPETMAAELVARGAGSVVLTMGADGAWAHDGAAISHVPAEPAMVADVTGAGDAMIAGTLLALGHGLPILAAARFGTMIAARTVASPLSVDAGLTPALAAAWLAQSAIASRSAS